MIARSQWILTFIFSLLVFVGCGQKTPSTPVTADNSSSPTNGSGSDNNNNNGNNDNGLPATSPNVTYATGWSTVTINANYAKTTVNSTAHFSTTRNACGKDAYNVIALDEWNNFSKNVNLAIQQPSLQEEYCVPAPTDTYKYMDGTTKILTDHGERILYEVRDYQICSTIQDHQISDALLSVVNQIILDADKTDCPNGWGSALRSPS